MNQNEVRLKVLHANRVWLQVQQNWIYNQLAHLPVDIESHVYCNYVANLSEYRVPNIHCVNEVSSAQRIGTTNQRGHSASLEDLIREIRPDILHSHFGQQGCDNMWVANRTDVAHVVTFYGHDATSWPKRSPKNPIQLRELFDSATAIFCEGPSLAEKVVALGCPSGKVIVHHLGGDMDKIPYRPRRWLPGTPLRVLIAATFRVKKGIRIAIQALREIRTDAALEITIIGDSRGDWDLIEKARILAAIDDSGLAVQTRLMGFQPHAVFLDEAYKHHVFLSPSFTTPNGDAEGGAPVAIIEMAASGMPIVSSLHCDIPEVIVDGQTGWLAPEKDWQALAGHLRWLIANPNGWRPYLDAGRRRMEEEFHCRTQGIRLAEHYRTVVDRQKGTL